MTRRYTVDDRATMNMSDLSLTRELNLYLEAYSCTTPGTLIGNETVGQTDRTILVLLEESAAPYAIYEPLQAIHAQVLNLPDKRIQL